MEGFATIQGSGARSSPAAPTAQQQGATAWGSAADSWRTTTTDASTTTSPGEQQPALATTGGPRLIIESEAGHQIVLTYQDLILLVTLVGLTTATVAAWRGS